MSKLVLHFFLVLVTQFSIGQNKFTPTGHYLQRSKLADSLYENKSYLQSALTFDTLLKHGKGEGLLTDKYNAACAWALAGNIEKAFYYLNKIAVAEQWSDFSHLLSDPDLNTLHNDKRWQQVIDKVKANKAKEDAKLNKPLVALLDTVYNEDQLERRRINMVEKQFGSQSKQMDSLWLKIKYQDSINLIRVKTILDSFGWLGLDEVGSQGATTIFLVIQHSDSKTQERYVPKMREAVKNGKALPQHLALLEDRILIHNNKKQIYGSQVRQNEATGKNEFFPILDEADVNKRREAVGLQPLEAYAKMFAIDYVLPNPTIKKK